MSLQRKNDNILFLKKGDIIIIAAVLLMAGIAVLFVMHQKSGDMVLITADGVTKTYPLNVDKEIELDSDSGGYNLIIISDGVVKMKEADCMNQICVNHKAIYKNHESIICLPNNVYVEVISSTDNDIDN